MSKKELHPLIGSSADPTKVATTIKGLLLSLIPIAVSTLGLADIDVTPEALHDLINTLFLAVTACITAFGAVRKFYLTVLSK